MFKITSIENLRIPVRIVSPDKSTGQIVLVIKYMGMEATGAYLDDVEFVSRKTDHKVINDLVLDVEDMVDQNDKPIDWGKDQKAILDKPYLFRPIRDALLDELTGRSHASGLIEKKLTSVARHLVNRAAGDVAVVTENIDAISAWVWISDQWKVAPMGGVIGLDWVAAKVILDYADIQLDREVLLKINVLEYETLQIINAAIETP